MDFHLDYQGKEMQVLLENPKNDSYFAYTDNYLKVECENQGFSQSHGQGKDRRGMNIAQQNYWTGKVRISFPFRLAPLPSFNG